MNLSILPQLLVNSLISGSLYALAASGMALSYGMMRNLNFAQGHFMMVGAYAFYFFFRQLEQPLLVSMLGTTAVCSALALFSYFCFIAPFQRFSSMLVFVSTLALGVMLENIVALIFGVDTKSLSVSYGQSSFEVASVFITPLQVFLIISSVLLLTMVALVLRLSALGRALRGLSELPPAAQTLGINAPLCQLLVFVSSILLATYAGVMVGFETNLQPTMGAAFTIKAFAAMVLGGIGNFGGAIVGSFILALVENLAIGLDFGSYSIPAGYKDAFAFTVILAVLIVKPEGLWGSKKRIA